MNNLCKFIPTRNTPDVIQTVNFVFESSDVEKNEKTCALYRINYVMSGEGVVSVNGVAREVREGDVFFILPATTYSIKGVREFSYAYVTYMGLRANILAERIGVKKSSFVYSSHPELKEFWQSCLELSCGVTDIASESVVLYTLSKIGDRQSRDDESDRVESGEKFLLIKKFIDDNFSDPNLCADYIGETFSYNPKYLSTAFKKYFKVGMNEYLTILRINHACALMERRYTGVSDVAFLCGFKDPMYFSKVFKSKMGVSPREYIASITNR